MMEIIHAVISKALDGLYMRQVATAQNIANAGSDHYRPVGVLFEDALREAMEARRGDSRALMQRVASVNPQLIDVAVDADDNVEIDQEVASASEISARYALLTGMLARSLQINELAIKGG